MKKQHYRIEEPKKIYANIVKLSEEEIEEIKKYQLFGYEVIAEQEKAKEPAKRLDDEYILDYLRNDKVGKETYISKKNEPVLNEDGTEKTKKDGTVKTKGFSNGCKWFATTYPENVEEVEKKIEESKKAEDFERVYKAYVKKTENSKDKEAMTKAQYTRHYYWTKVFVRVK